MFESQFKPSLQKQEQGEFEPTPLETVQLSEIPVHEGVRKEIKLEIAKKIVRLEKLKKGAPAEFENEKNILLAGLQNIVAQELLSQADGPTSLTKKDFKGFIEKQNKDLADEYFSDQSWNGMRAVSRAVELDLKAEDNLSDKQVIFCNLLDADDATDYILAGKNTDAEDLRYTFKLVQVGVLDGDKSQSDIKGQHVSLARRLSNETSPETVFENNREEILQFVGEIAENLPEGNISLGSVTELLLEKHFDISDIHESLDEIDIMEQFSARERQLFTDDFEKFTYLAQQDFSAEEREGLIKEIADSDEGLDMNKIEELVLLITKTFNSPQLLKSVPVDFISRTMVRFNDRITEKDIPLDEVDSKLVPMYHIDESELSNLLKANMHGKTQQDEAA